MEDALDLQQSVPLRPSSPLRSTLDDSQDLLSQLKHSLVKATGGESAFLYGQVIYEMAFQRKGSQKYGGKA